MTHLVLTCYIPDILHRAPYVTSRFKGHIIYLFQFEADSGQHKNLINGKFLILNFAKAYTFSKPLEDFYGTVS